MTRLTRQEAVEHIVRLGHGHLRNGSSHLGAEQEVALKHFRKRVVANPGAFLDQVQKRMLERKEETVGLSKSHARQLAVLEGPGDLFGPLDHIRAEVLHTRAIAWALSPWRLKRGIGHDGLRAFLAMLQRHEPGIDAEWAMAATDGCTTPEYDTGDRGRVDVWLDLPTVLIAVEAKIDATERADQLKDYRAAVTRERGKKRPGHTVFLALNRPTVCSDPKAIKVGFVDMLRALLPVAAAGDDHDHHYLGLYLRTVARNLLQISDAGPFETWAPARMARTLTLLGETR